MKKLVGYADSLSGLGEKEKKALVSIIQTINSKKRVTKKQLKDLCQHDFDKILQKPLADMLGESRQNITNWCAKGCPRNPDNTFSLRKVFQWYKSNGRGTGDADVELKKARIKKLEFELREKEKELVPREEARQRMVTTLRSVKGMYERVDKILAQMLVGSTSSKNNERVISYQRKDALDALQESALVEEW